MDTSDPYIVFDNRGYCNHCNQAELLLKARWHPDEKGQHELRGILENIKFSSRRKQYDCIMGLSGGVDSSYLLHMAVEGWGLRVLAVHVNAGWNSEDSESNIERLVKKLGVDLYTYVVDWEEVRDLQLAYFRSGVKNQDIPQDHIFFAQLYKKAVKEKIDYVLTGHNLATESITPSSWGYNAMDSRQIKYIQKKFGTKPLKSYTLLSLFEKLYFTTFLGQKVVKPLDFMVYDKEKAKLLLQEIYGWKDYGAKHSESVFTKFYQNYWLLNRYGYDVRKAHLSSLIISGFITREQALEQLKKPLYDEDSLRVDIEYICNKLEISLEDLNSFMEMPKIEHSAYPSVAFITNLIMRIRDYLKFGL